jgi:hypothetical protein
VRKWIAQLGVAIALCGPAGSALAQTAEPSDPKATEVGEAARAGEPEAEVEPTAPPEADFRPTESVPPGSSVSFPVDI